MTKRLLIITVAFIFASLVYSPRVKAAEKVKISGEAQYTYGDSESIIEARETCYSMAVRNAIEGYKAFVASTSEVKDYQLIKDLIKTISSGCVEGLKIVEENISKRTIYIKVEGFIISTKTDKLLEREINWWKSNAVELGEPVSNGYIKILEVRQLDNIVVLVYTILKHESGVLNYIIIDQYNADGNPIRGQWEYVDGVNPKGVILEEEFIIPRKGKTYCLRFINSKSSFYCGKLP